MRQVGDEAPPELEFEAEPVLPVEEVARDIVPEPAAPTEEVLADATARGDDASAEVMEAYVEPEPAAPEEAAVHPEPAPAEAEGEAPSEEEITLEDILRDLRRREGRE
jgi:hypothetical protein